MKTPREIILEKHERAETKLSAIRGEELAAIARPPHTSETKADWRTFFMLSLASNFWAQAILPWRRAWTRMAAVWLAIIVLNLAAHSGPPSAMAQASRADASASVAAWHERQQFMAQLFAPMDWHAEVTRKIPAPRSCLRIETVAA